MSGQINWTELILGRLSWEALPLHDPIIVATFAMVALGGAVVLGALTYFHLWKTLWRDWITSIDHKHIGIMYMVLGIVMLLRGFTDALMMRAQQAIAFGDSAGFLPPHHYDQIFTAHGVIMIFFVAMPLVTGLMNYIVPLQIGARDVAFPFLNNFSFWMTGFGCALIMASLFVGEFARTGWLAYPPLSGILASPDVGVDYYIWALQIAGMGTLLSGVNLIATIVKMRAPGMTMMKMPVFIWTALCTNILIVAAFPVLTAVLGMLSMDRLLGTNFFTSDLGGNAMMYVNLIWIWGHPEVYILILPVFGVFSEVVATFTNKRLFGYTSMVYAIVVITILAYLVWLHHFFTMGSGASVNSFFGITTMIISIPTGAKVLIAANPEQAQELLKIHKPGFAVVDLQLQGHASGLTCVQLLHQHNPAMLIVVLTGFASISTAVEAIKLGSCQYLAKPSNTDDIEAAFNHVAGNTKLDLTNRRTSIKNLEWERIHEMLVATNYNISETARQLGMHRRTLARKLEKQRIK